MATKFRGITRKGPAPNPISQQVQTKFQQALALHQRGQISQAQALYREVLKAQPKHFDALHLLGVTAIQAGEFELGIRLIGDAIKVNPNVASAYNNRGNALKDIKRLDEALASYDQALSLKPDYADAYNNRGVVLRNLMRLDEALASYDKALSLKPDDPDAYKNRGNVLKDLRRLDEALASYDQALSLKPDYPGVYNNRGNALRELGRLDEALTSYDKALSLKSDYVEAYNNRGNVLKDLERPDEALASHDKALSLKPDDPDAHNNRGNVLKDLGRLDEALASYDKALSLKPDYPDAHNNRGNVLMDLRRLDEALASYDKALSLNPNVAEAYYNRGNALLDLKRLNEALASYGKALSLKPDYPDAYNNRGIVLRDLWRREEALTSYDKALLLKPDYPDAHNNRGNVLMDLRRLGDALASYDKVLTLKPDYVGAYNNRGNVLRDLKRLEEALASYEMSLKLNPEYEFVFGNFLHTKMELCDWNALSENLGHYEAKIAISNRVTMPFPALSLIDKPELHRKAAELYAQARYPKSEALGEIARRPAKGRIRVGYYSPDFRNHPVAYLLAELFESHSKDKFEIIGFSFGLDANDQMRQRLSASFARFIDVRNMSDQGVAKLSRELSIDIAVDLAGFTLDSRSGLFAEGCAPIQVNYIGYPGTMGMDRIDYVIADKTVIPAQNHSHFTEKIVYLPHCFQANDSKRKISDREFTRQELELPETGFVFCCFNQSYKILPRTFDSWMRILNAVEGSVLWLYADNTTAISNLRKEAESRGVQGRRLVFAKRLKYDEHLTRYRWADVFLDTLPYNAGTTASDALWAGLPVLTCIGQSFAGRMAASLLRAVDLPELITLTQKEYEAKAIELALNPDRLQDLKSRLAKNRLTTPLFNGKLFARHIESAYGIMYARYQAGLGPASFEVEV